VISTKHKFVFFRVPKTASQSIDFAVNKYYVKSPSDLFINAKNPMRKLAKHCSYYHLKNIQAIRPARIPNIDDYYKFAFVRNPWDRLVSYFFGRTDKLSGRTFLAKEKEHKMKRFFNNWLTQENLKHRQWGPTNWKGMRFGQYPILEMQQIQYATNDMSTSGKIELDFIGRFETLQRDIKKISNDIGIEINLGERHIGKRKRRHYSYFYNNSSIEIVSRRFCKDIEVFDYRYEAG